MEDSCVNNSLISTTLLLENSFSFFSINSLVVRVVDLCSQVLLDKLLESLILESLNILDLNFSILEISWHPLLGF